MDNEISEEERTERNICKLNTLLDINEEKIAELYDELVAEVYKGTMLQLTLNADVESWFGLTAEAKAILRNTYFNVVSPIGCDGFRSDVFDDWSLDGALKNA